MPHEIMSQKSELKKYRSDITSFGKNAFLDGRNLLANPFVKKSSAHRWWASAWKKAKKGIL